MLNAYLISTQIFEKNKYLLEIQKIWKNKKSGKIKKSLKNLNFLNFISEIIDHESNYKKVLSAIIKYLKLKVPIQILSLPSWTTADDEMWACAAVSNTWHAQVEQYHEYCGNAQIAKTTINKPKSPWQLRSVLNVICTNNKDDNNKLS